MTVWKDDACQARLSKVLVIEVAEQPGVRRLYEDEFGRQLAAFGTQGISSHIILPSLDQIQDRDAVAYRVKELIWSALSETRGEGASENAIRSFIKLLVKDLAGNRLLGS